jgi:hypothetical protein
MTKILALVATVLLFVAGTALPAAATNSVYVAGLGWARNSGQNSGTPWAATLPSVNVNSHVTLRWLYDCVVPIGSGPSTCLGTASRFGGPGGVSIYASGNRPVLQRSIHKFLEPSNNATIQTWTCYVLACYRT